MTGGRAVGEVRAGLTGCLILLVVACGGREASEPASRSTDARGLAIAVTLDRLECVEQNDATGLDDEVFVVAAWSGATEGRRRQPDGGSWQMCGRNEFEPVVLFDGALGPGERIDLDVTIGEDDRQAERVSNQIDDTLARFGLGLEPGGDRSVRADATPGEIRDNNLTGLPPRVDLELDPAGRTLTFESRYSNADGPVHYRGRVSW